MYEYIVVKYLVNFFLVRKSNLIFPRLCYEYCTYGDTKVSSQFQCCTTT